MPRNTSRISSHYGRYPVAGFSLPSAELRLKPAATEKRSAERRLKPAATRWAAMRSAASGCVALVCACMLAMGCGEQDMARQPRVDPDEGSPLFADGKAVRPPVRGTVARGQLRDDPHLF